MILEYKQCISRLKKVIILNVKRVTDTVHNFADVKPKVQLVKIYRFVKEFKNLIFHKNEMKAKRIVILLTVYKNNE